MAKRSNPGPSREAPKESRASRETAAPGNDTAGPGTAASADDSADNETSDAGLFQRLFKVVKALFGIHITVMVQEGKDFGAGILRSVVLFLCAGILGFGFWLLLNVLAILALSDFAGLSYFFATLVATGVNLLIVLIVILAARAGIRKKHFKLTRQLLKDTAQALKP